MIRETAYIILLILTSTAVFFLLTKAEININFDMKTIEIIQVIISGVGVITTGVAVLIAYKAYQQWHKPNSYSELLKARKKLIGELIEIERIVHITSDQIRLPLIKTLNNFEIVFKGTEIHELSDDEKVVLIEELKNHRKKLKPAYKYISNCIRDSELLFHKTPKTLKENLDKFTRTNTAYLFILTSSLDNSIKLLSTTNKETEEMNITMIRTRIKHINEFLREQQREVTAEKLKQLIEKELREFSRQ